MSEEKDLMQLGGQGIDTQYERDLINYRPKFDYKKNGSGGTGGLSVDAAGQGQLEKIGNSTPLATMWERVVDVIDNLNKLEKQLSEKLANVSAKVSNRNIDSVKKAARVFGYELRDEIPFDLYKETFNHIGSGEAEVIKDAYEDYQSDVSGVLNAELYADVREMQQDWEDMIPFINKGLFGQVVSPDKYPIKVSKDDVNLQAIHSAEQELTETYAQALKLARINEDIMYHLMVNENGSERFYELEEAVREDRKKLDDLRRRIYTKAEVVELLEKKLVNTSDNAEYVVNSIDFLPYNSKEYDIVHHILRQYMGRGNMTQRLRKLQAVLKLSVDGKKEDTNAKKALLRGMSGRSTKNKINRTLVNGVHLRNEVFGDVYEIMEYFDGVPDSRVFEDVANHITQGISRAEQSYYNQSMDFYKIHSMDAELRTNKLQGLIDKDSARSIYKMVEGVLRFMKQTNNWPDSNNLTQWLGDFMEYYKSS